VTEATVEEDAETAAILHTNPFPLLLKYIFADKLKHVYVRLGLPVGCPAGCPDEVLKVA
jgi:hypothetical protein